VKSDCALKWKFLRFGFHVSLISDLWQTGWWGKKIQKKLFSCFLTKKRNQKHFRGEKLTSKKVLRALWTTLHRIGPFISIQSHSPACYGASSQTLLQFTNQFKAIFDCHSTEQTMSSRFQLSSKKKTTAQSLSTLHSFPAQWALFNYKHIMWWYESSDIVVSRYVCISSNIIC